MCAMFNVFNVLFAMCATCNVEVAMCNVQCALCNVCNVCNVLFAMCNVQCGSCNVCNLLFAMCATSANKRAAWKTSRFGPRRSQHSWKRGFTTKFIFDIESAKSDKSATNTEQIDDK